jgi:hypothetical protein
LILARNFLKTQEVDVVRVRRIKEENFLQEAKEAKDEKDEKDE